MDLSFIVPLAITNAFFMLTLAVNNRRQLEVFTFQRSLCVPTLVWGRLRCRLNTPSVTMTAATPIAQCEFTLHFDADSRRYPIFFSEGVISKPDTFKPFITSDKVLIATNSTIALLYLNQDKSAVPGTIVSVFDVGLPHDE